MLFFMSFVATVHTNKTGVAKKRNCWKHELKEEEENNPKRKKEKEKRGTENLENEMTIEHLQAPAHTYVTQQGVTAD